MPDIIIRGMEMPKSCDECPCFSQYDACDVTGSWKFADEFDKSTARLPDCPLHELPPHGDLIDRDALGEFPFNMSFCDGYEADEWVQNAPAIVPASKSKEETA